MPITKEQFVRESMEIGAFKALATHAKNGNIRPNKADDVADGIFDFLIGRFEEGQRETARINAVLTRLISTARAGKIPARGQSWTPKESVINSFVQDIKTLHNWVVSLYETDFTILDTIDPRAANEHPQSMANAMNNVRAERKKRLEHGTHFPEFFFDR
jgi:hypothetical protein